MYKCFHKHYFNPQSLFLSFLTLKLAKVLSLGKAQQYTPLPLKQNKTRNKLRVAAHTSSFSRKGLVKRGLNKVTMHLSMKLSFDRLDVL